MADDRGGAPDAPRAPSRLEATRTRLSLVIGLVMVGLGGFVALRPLWNRTPLTGQRWTDIAFALFFLLRGAMYLRSLRRGRAAG